MRLSILLALTVAAASAGPVGRYLGFAVERQGSSIGAGRDSIHIILPPTDSVSVRSRVDTAQVVAETLYGSNPAWLIRRVSMPRPAAEMTDTSYESGDTLLCTRTTFGDSLLWLNSYRVPFTIGTTWLSGVAGSYVYDFNGDTIMDTLSIWGDTCRVADTEDVTVPYGTVTGCARIARTMFQRLATTLDTIAVIESSYIRTFEWYKDSLWSLKESVYATGPVYTKIIGFWFHTADFTSVDVSVLDGYRLSLFAERHPSLQPALTATPNPFRSSTTIRFSSRTPAPTLSVYDASGRIVLSQPVRTSSFVLHTSSLPVGAYFLRVGNEVCPVTKAR